MLKRSRYKAILRHQRKRQRQRHLRSFGHSSRRYHTSRIVAEVTSIILVVSLCVHFLAVDPCGQNNPITFLGFLYAPDETTGRCIESIAKSKTSSSQHKTTKTEVLGASLSEVAVDKNHVAKAAKTYRSKYFPDGKVTLDRLRSMPESVKSLCDGKCRALVKQHLSANNGQIQLNSQTMKSIPQ